MWGWSFSSYHSVVLELPWRVCMIARGFGEGVRANAGQTLCIPGDQSCVILSHLACFVGNFVHKGAPAHLVSGALYSRAFVFEC